MLKAFRKYNKIILVIGGCILMVAFTLPQLPQLFGGAGFSQKIAAIEDTTVRGEEFRDIRQEWQIIQQVLLQPAPLGIQDTDHYMLLRYEAQKYGIIGGQRDGEALIPSYAERAVLSWAVSVGLNRFLRAEQFQQRIQQETASLTETLENRRVAVITQSAGGNAAAVNNALAKFHGIFRLLNANASFIPNSRPEAIDEAQNLYDRVIIDYAIVPAGSTDAAAQLATDEELQAFFNDHADIPASEDPFGISYLRPPALALEYVLISKPTVEQLIQIEDDLPLRSFYDDLPEDERIALGSFRDARAEVERRYRSQQAEELLGDISAAIRSRLQNTRRALDRDEDTDALLLPADWNQTRPTLADIEQIAASRLPEGPAQRDDAPAITTARSQPNSFFTRREFGLGRPFETDGTNPISRDDAQDFLAPFARANIDGEFEASSILFATRELGDSRTTDIPENYNVQAGAFFDRPVTTRDGSIVFVRPLAARPESPPDSWRDIEERLRTDFARVANYQTNLDNAQTYADAAATDGIQALADANPEILRTVTGAVVTSTSVFSLDTTTLRRTPLPEVNDPDFRDAVLAVINDWSPDTLASSIPAPQRTVTVGLPASTSLVVATVTGRWPVTRERFEDNTQGILNQLRQRARLNADGQSFFSLEALKERLNYRDLTNSR